MKSRGLMLIHNFRPGPVGGAELQAERLAARLVKLGHPMQVLTQRTVPAALPEETIEEVTIHRTSFRMPYWILLDNANTFQFLFKNRESFDILHVHIAYGHAVHAVVFARSFGKKCIVKIACAGEYGELNAFSKFVGFDKALPILHQADVTVAISSEVEQELLSYGFSPDRIVRIPNGVDTAHFRRQRPFPERGKTRFLLACRRHPQKGIDVALKAVCLLAEQGYADQFEVASYGLDYPEYDYRAMARKLGVADSVHFFPFEYDSISLYQSAHCFLLPSRGEGLSNALLEAMAMEMPVIATAVSGALDVVDDEVNGLLIPADSAEALATSMLRIILDQQLAHRLGQSARRKIEQHFSLERVARQYSELYERLR